MSRKKADLVLVLVTAFWGSSYLFMKAGLESIATFNLIALRFFIGFVITAMLFYRRLRHVDRRTFFYSLILALTLVAVFAMIMFGLKSTSASKAGFLNALTVVFVPFLNLLFFRVKLDPKIVTVVFLSLLGIGLLTWNGRLFFETGDLYCIFGALCNAGYIVLTGRFTKRVDSIALGVWQMGFTSMIALLISFIFETPQMPSGTMPWLSVLGLGILCSAAGYMMQNVAQRYTVSAHAGLIFTLEPIFAALFAFVFTGEVLPARGYIGAGIVMCSIVLMEVDIRRFFHPHPARLN